jgi:hypothetical protein
MRQRLTNHIARSATPAVLLALAVVACQQPGAPATDDAGSSPVAPAVEPSHPNAEQTIPLPSATPVAPAIEPGPTGPDPTIEIPEGVELPSTEPVAPRIQPEPIDPDPTVAFDP